MWEKKPCNRQDDEQGTKWLVKAAGIWARRNGKGTF